MNRTDHWHRDRRARQLALFGLLAAIALSLTACGGTPTAPDNSPPAGTVQVAGDWTGTWTFNTAGTMVTDDVTMALAQTGANATGTWTGASGATGQVSFLSTAAFSGSLTINIATFGGGSCNASTTIQGTAMTNRLELNLADIAPQGICQWGSGGRFVLTR